MNQIRMSKLICKGKAVGRQVPFQMIKKGEGVVLQLFLDEYRSGDIEVPDYLVGDMEWIEYKSQAFLQHLQTETENEYK